MASGYLMEQPLVIQGSQEEAGGVFGNTAPLQFLPSAKNYAEDQKTRDFFRDEIAPIMIWTRQDRQGLEVEWNDIRNMTAMKHDAGRRYFGRSDSYLPIYKRERQKMISTLSKGLFPSDEYFDVLDLSSGDPERAKPVKVYMQWELEKNAKIRNFMKPHLGTLCDFGTAPMKFWYKKEIVSRGGVTSRASALKGLMQQSYGFKNYSCEGLAVSPRNLFYWYIYPSTAESIDLAQMIFEDIDIPLAFVKWMKDAKRWFNVDDIISSMGGEDIPEHDRAQQDLLRQRGEGMQMPGQGMAGSMSGAQVTLSEVWTFMQLPRDAYMSHEDPRLAIPVVVTCMGDRALDIRRNPFFHQKAPYAVSRIDWESGLFYGNAQGRIIRPMQLLSNDFMNQTNDNGIMGLNPIALIDINKLAPGVPPSYYPGAAWYTLGPDAVKFDRPPIDQVQMGMGMVNMNMGMAQDMGGSPPDYGSKTRAGNTATGMSIAQSNVQKPISDTVQDIEGDTMIPILEGAWKNAVQYRDEEVMISIAGERISIRPDMLAIDADFRYLASSQAMNQQVRTQQMLTLIPALVPLVPVIMQQGYIIDFVSLIKKVWVDGFGYRGFQEFIRKAQAVPGQAGPGMVRPDQMGGVQAEQQGNYRSALEQLHGGMDPAAQAQPGEADDFSQVRDQADQMAGMAGGYGGLQ